MLENKLLSSTPINDMYMGPMKPQYVRRVLWYLKHDLGCMVQPLKEQEGYYVVFPTGTVENLYEGRSTLYTHETILKLPTGREITKYVHTKLDDMTKSTTTLAIPKTVLEGPEPPEQG